MMVGDDTMRSMSVVFLEIKMMFLMLMNQTMMIYTRLPATIPDDEVKGLLFAYQARRRI